MVTHMPRLMANHTFSLSLTHTQLKRHLTRQVKREKGDHSKNDASKKEPHKGLKQAPPKVGTGPFIVFVEVSLQPLTDHLFDMVVSHSGRDQETQLRPTSPRLESFGSNPKVSLALIQEVI